MPEIPPYQPVEGDLLDPDGVASNTFAMYEWLGDAEIDSQQVTNLKMLAPFGYGFPMTGKKGISRDVFFRHRSSDAPEWQNKSFREDLFGTPEARSYRADGKIAAHHIAWTGHLRLGDEVVIRAWFSFINIGPLAEYGDLLGEHSIGVKLRGDANWTELSTKRTSYSAATLSALPAEFPSFTRHNMLDAYDCTKSGIYDIVILFTPDIKKNPLTAASPYQMIYGRHHMGVSIYHTDQNRGV